MKEKKLEIEKEMWGTQMEKNTVGFLKVGGQGEHVNI